MNVSDTCQMYASDRHSQLLSPKTTLDGTECITVKRMQIQYKDFEFKDSFVIILISFCVFSSR